ncbi:MAG: NADH-quinone oxidoreductase subunit K [Thiotrichales bacterium]
MVGGVLFVLGLGGLILRPHVLSKILAFNILGSGAFLILVGLGQRGGAPDPVPQADGVDRHRRRGGGDRVGLGARAAAAGSDGQHGAAGRTGTRSSRIDARPGATECFVRCWIRSPG